jgi:hypothetical protein
MGGLSCKGQGHHDERKSGVIEFSRAKGYCGVSKARVGMSESRAAVPIQIGFVKLGGMFDVALLEDVPLLVELL